MGIVEVSLLDRWTDAGGMEACDASLDLCLAGARDGYETRILQQIPCRKSAA